MCQHLHAHQAKHYFLTVTGCYDSFSYRDSLWTIAYRLDIARPEAATQLCTCVFDCNVPLLRRYIKAGIIVNAGNFDSRTALHVAAAEGNLAAVCRWPMSYNHIPVRVMPMYT